MTEFRNERVQVIQTKPGLSDRETGEETKQVKVCCYPTEPGKYGNNYSGFFTDTQIDKVFGGLGQEDFNDQDVLIGFNFRDYTSQYGKPAKAKD